MFEMLGLVLVAAVVVLWPALEILFLPRHEPPRDDLRVLGDISPSLLDDDSGS